MIIMRVRRLRGATADETNDISGMAPLVSFGIDEPELPPFRTGAAPLALARPGNAAREPLMRGMDWVARGARGGGISLGSGRRTIRDASPIRRSSLGSSLGASGRGIR